MGADATPDDVLLAADYLRAVLPRRAAVAVPGEFEDAGCAPYALDAKAGAERSPGAEGVIEGDDGVAEGASLFGGEAMAAGRVEGGR
ncbi:hypothetical protein [Streptomyces caniscabiei]|uniref:hypothetical protein n=1 Tax=Streptomyces caniscabiei TaxID=2746961 RepID=UPI0015C4FF5F|nr:hypothetical protein [Streptomyces caniscabiei]